MRIFVRGDSAEMSFAALIPSILGMRTSNRAMSGSVSRDLTTASWPSAASATTFMSLALSSNILRLCLNNRSSSAIKSLSGIESPPLQSYPGTSEDVFLYGIPKMAVKLLEPRAAQEITHFLTPHPQELRCERSDRRAKALSGRHSAAKGNG